MEDLYVQNRYIQTGIACSCFQKSRLYSQQGECLCINVDELLSLTWIQWMKFLAVTFAPHSANDKRNNRTVKLGQDISVVMVTWEGEGGENHREPFVMGECICSQGNWGAFFLLRTLMFGCESVISWQPHTTLVLGFSMSGSIWFISKNNSQWKMSAAFW